ncbi:anti-sigma regulatory factor (Ser/Thr protein kinase) [Streptomyces netropsis]|uniref:Anti-sigma regulatory factor (Ser/Thr protein kinase) n=2 Tax=Streptomyces netropsis TaxID=55404 RepID=A0A7W7LIL9_STRNE|nr:anti-sigma regulatory factor (Ser/Thr protein kinase) [Streptomyces netropsis]
MRARKANRSVKGPSAVPLHDVVQDGSQERFRAMTLFVESPDTVRAARDMTRSALEDWGLNDLVDDARLVVSELVGNVVHHAVPDQHLSVPGAHRRIDVTLRKWPDWLLIGVADEDSSPPTFPVGDMFSPHLVDGLPEALLPDCGRGLMLVQRLADALWWCPGDGGGKTVICRFDLAGRSASLHR